MSKIWLRMTIKNLGRVMTSQKAQETFWGFASHEDEHPKYIKENAVAIGKIANSMKFCIKKRKKNLSRAYKLIFKNHFKKYVRRSVTWHKRKFISGNKKPNRSRTPLTASISKPKTTELSAILNLKKKLNSFFFPLGKSQPNFKLSKDSKSPINF